MARYGYLALYNGAHMLNDSAMLGIAVVTLRRREPQERSAPHRTFAQGSAS